MNNALLTNSPDENEPDLTIGLRTRETELVNMIDAIIKVAGTSEWKALEGLIFNKQVEALERELRSEAKRKELNTPEIYRLNGKIEIANRYSDLDKLANTYRLELINIRKRLKDG